MIQFRQKTFSEYDAMRSLYVELLKKGDKNKWKVIDKDSLIPVLRGNNVVIERFVISTSFAHRDRYRLYLKIGAKAKLPDEVRLPERVYDKRLGNATLNFNMGLFAPGTKNRIVTAECDHKGVILAIIDVIREKYNLSVVVDKKK